MLKLGRVTKVKVLFLVLVFVFNFDVYKFLAAILEKGLLLGIDGIVLPIRKKLIGSQVVFLTMILTLMFCFQHGPSFISLSNSLSTSVPLCMFCSILTCNMHCKLNCISFLDELLLLLEQML